MEKRIAAVIVTFNRKQLLERCLLAVSMQTVKPKTVYIVDNASTDGTIDAVKNIGLYECVRDGVAYKYILNSINEGGAGGFFLGMKTAKEDGDYDAYWVMDDDGAPDSNCLAELQKYLDNYDYIAPIVLSDEDHHSCSFAPNHEDVNTFSKMKGSKNGIITNWASPFNGILYSKRLVEKVGYPDRRMFIWGDETNYHVRCQNAGFIPYTILNAVHYHPLNKVEYVISAGLIISISNVDWKLYCCVRNTTFNELYYATWFPKNIYRVLRLYKAYVKYFPEKKQLIRDAMTCGIFKDFSRLENYKQ